MEEKTIGCAYVAPEIERIELEGMSVLCQSQNQSMNETDYGDGGFTEN